MLKVLSKALLLCFIMGSCIPETREETTFYLTGASQKLTYSKTEVKRICSVIDIQDSVGLIDEKMAELLRTESVQSTGSRTIHDFAGHDFVVARYDEKGYGILNVANDDIVEIAPFSPLPFDWEAEDVRYIPLNGFYEAKDGSFVNSETDEVLSQGEISYLEDESARFVEKSIDDKNEALLEQAQSSTTVKSAKTKSVDSGKHPLEEGLIYADVEVPYSWYFKRNSTQFPDNQKNSDGKGDCGYVAASFLLAYNEIFNSTGYFSTEQSVKYIKSYAGTKTNDGWDGVPELIDSFPHDIWGSEIGESFPWTISDAINSFMSGKDKKYDIYNYVWKFSTVTDPVREGVPAAYFGNAPKVDTGNGTIPHVVVVYGYYNDGKLLVHYGWNNYSQVVISQYGTYDLGGVIGIYNKSLHKHNKYFGDKATRKNYCGCGALMEC